MGGRVAMVLGAAAWLALGALLAHFALDASPAAVAAMAAGGLEFAHPERGWLFGIAWIVPLLALGSLGDLPRWQSALAAVVRMAIVAVLAVALMEPRTRQEQPQAVSIVHLVDRSESISPVALARAVSAIEADVAAHSADVGEPVAGVDVVAFDGRAVRLPWPPTPLTDANAEDDARPLPPLRIERDVVGQTASDLEGAVDLAIGLLDPARVPHVVIWSDGHETRGDVSRLGDLLRRAGVRVHRGDIGDAPVGGEVLVEAVDVPERVRANLPFPVSLGLRATAAATVSCSVKGEGVSLGPVVAELKVGNTSVAMGQARLRKAGAHEFEAQCKVVAGGDRFQSNNAMRVRVAVTARPKVLYVEGTPSSARYLARALDDDFDLTVRGPEGLPRDAAALDAFEAVVVSDLARVSAAGVVQVGDSEQRALGAFADKGGGLLFVGGEDALGSGGWQGSWLEKHVLPVRLEVDSSVEQPSIAMMLVLDRSGSMAGQKIELAKEAARATAEALGHEDRIGVIAFEQHARLVVPIQRAGNRYRIATRIGSISPSGGTMIYPALQLAFTELERVRAKVKHIILLSDGDAPTNGIDALVRQMRRSGITVTAVGVGTGANRGMLESIAERGGGRSYFTDRPETLPRIFVRETREIAGETVVERRVRAKLAPGVGRIDLLRGVDLAGLPPLRGFLTSKTRAGAEEILRVSSGEPLLVRWRRGLGKVSVWTSDLKNRWAQDWIDGSDYAVLSRQLVRDLLREDNTGEVDVRLAREADTLRVAVDAMLEDAYAGGLSAVAKVRPPVGPSREVPLREVALGRYEVSVPMVAFGPYDVEVEVRTEANRPVMLRGRATAVRPYPDELRIAPAGATPLDALVALTSGSADARPDHWRDRGNASTRTWQPLWPTLMALALALLMLDLLLRRVRLGRARPSNWFGAGR